MPRYRVFVKEEIEHIVEIDDAQDADNARYLASKHMAKFKDRTTHFGAKVLPGTLTAMASWKAEEIATEDGS